MLTPEMVTHMMNRCHTVSFNRKVGKNFDPDIDTNFALEGNLFNPSSLERVVVDEDIALDILLIGKGTESV